MRLRRGSLKWSLAVSFMNRQTRFSFFCLWVFLSTCCLWPAAAQVSAPSLLDSQFDGPDEETALHLTLLQPFSGPAPTPGVTWEGRDELTVHTNKGRQGLLEDLHANGSLLTLRLSLGRSPSAPRLLLRRESLETGGTDNESGDALYFRGHFRRPEAALSWPLPRQGLASVGYRQTDYTADGTTHLYNNLFTIFPDTPPFRYEGRERLVWAGARSPLAKTWQVEGIVGSESEPSQILLRQDGLPTQVALPMRDAGLTALLAAQRRLPRGEILSAYIGGEHLSGRDEVDREGGRAIGTAVTTHREAGGGLGWLRPFGGSRRLGLYAEIADDRWETRGFVPDPGELQTRYSLTSDLRYAARYSAAKRTLGASWEQNYHSGQTLHGTIQFLTLTLHADAAYSVRFFGLARSGQTFYEPSHLRAFLLRGRYTVPINHLRLGLEASQLVPLANHSGGSNQASTGLPDPDRRTTTGGWALNLRIERPF